MVQLPQDLFVHSGYKLYPAPVKRGSRHSEITANTEVDDLLAFSQRTPEATTVIAFARKGHYMLK
jgi:hypothetical protein